MNRARWFSILALASALLLTGCGLPHIIVLNDPLSPEEHLRLGMAYEEKGEYQSALREYQAAAPKQPLAHQMMGNVYQTLKQYDRAEKEYRKAIELMPFHPDPYNNLAWMYLTQHIRLDEAEELAWRAISLAPESNRSTYWDTLDKIREARH